MNPALPIPLSRPVAFLDLETTGLNRSEARIVEMALLILYPDGRALDKVRRFNPGIPIPADASAVHGIHDADVAGEAPFRKRARSLAMLLDGCDLAGFNILGFDLHILLEEFRRAEIPFDLNGRRLIDAQVIFHREEPRNLTAAARHYLQEEHADAHGARADVRMTARVLAAQLTRYPDLPDDIEGLHAYCDQVKPFETPLRKWFEGEELDSYVFRRSRDHKGKRLVEVAARDPGFLRWMLRLDDLADEVREVVREALERHDTLERHGGGEGPPEA